MRLVTCTKNLSTLGAVAAFLIASAGLPSLSIANPLGSAGTLMAYAQGEEVDVELLLAVDISQSMDTDEQEVQRAGYIAALTSHEVLDAIQQGLLGKIAVTYMEWGGTEEQFTIADWSIIHDKASAERFAAQIAEAPLHQVQRTSISSALDKSVQLMSTNSYEGLRKVIDISGDGPNNQGDSVTATRDRVLQTGITINGLPLMMKDQNSAWQTMLHLDHYYEDCVIGGPGAFAIPVRSKGGFAEAIRMKLVLEIAGLTVDQPRVMRAAGREKINCSLFE